MPAAGRDGIGRRTLLRALPVVAGAPLLAQCTRDEGPAVEGPAVPSIASSRARSRGEPTERLDYGADPSQYAELTRPSGTARGVVVLVHGGFWMAEYGLDLMRPLASDLAGRGYAALNVEYRRIGRGAGGGGGFPATFDDVSAAIDLLARTDLDLTDVVAVGHSAGGHLAVWAAARGRSPQWAAAKVELTGVVSQAGVLDLTGAERDRLDGGVLTTLLGPSSSGRAVRDLVDPTRQVPLDVPVRCVHGRADEVVPVSQSEDYVRAATAAGADATLTLLDGDHLAVIDPGGPGWPVQCALLEALLH